MQDFNPSPMDKDTQFVGALDGDGLFTPGADGPNPKRKGDRTNSGDVWVIATAKNDRDRDGKPLSSRVHMVIADPPPTAPAPPQPK